MKTRYFSYIDFKNKIEELGSEDAFLEFIKTTNHLYRNEALEYLDKYHHLKESQNQSEEVISLTLEANRLSSRSNILSFIAIIVSIFGIIIAALMEG